MSLISSWWNGEACDGLPIEARGAHYGDGVFRTMLCSHHRIDGQDWQLMRLCQDAAALRIPMTEGHLAQALSALALPARAVVKLMVMRGGHARGYTPEAEAKPNLAAFAYDPPTYPAVYWADGIEVVTLQAALSAHDGLAGVKHCNRLEQVLAAHELARYGKVEGLCRAPSGGLQCGTRSNLFWQAGQVLYTPRIRECGVRGVTRDRIMAAAPEIGLQVHEVAPPSSQTLLEADGVFLCNSVFGIWPVKALDDEPVAVSATAQKLMQQIEHPGLDLADSRA